MNPTSPKESSDLLIGREVAGTYRLVELLGQGGMAAVFRGQHLVTDQDVAIKVLPPDLASQPDVKARFIAEARTLARLEHPNIVTLHNFLQEQGHLYIVMQFAEGETFDFIIEREGRVAVSDAIAVGIETLEALIYAHAQQVVHRDIKPSNIVIRGDGAVKVMDFGIAKILGSTKLTETGQTMGTVRYMSPEQVRGKQVDHRTDIYSLGVSLYEACTGRTPFDGDTHFEIMHKHLSEVPVPPIDLADIPSQFNDALMCALEKRPEERFQSAEEFKRALRGVPVDDETRRVTRPKVPRVGAQHVPESVGALHRWHSGRLQMLVAVGLLLLSAAAVLWALVTDEPAPSAALGGPMAPLAHRTAIPWPDPHRVARTVKWDIDERLEPEQLRVLAKGRIDVAAIKAYYTKARAAYGEFLAAEGIDLQVLVRPLNLVFLPAAKFDAQRGWESPRYEPASSTLYVRRARGASAKRDLPHGFALHFCVHLGKLSNQRCLELAEAFEQVFRQTKTVR